MVDRQNVSMTLGERDGSILILLASGYTYAEVGEVYGVTVSAIGKHVSVIKRTLGARSLPHAVALACLSGDLTNGHLQDPPGPPSA